MATPEDDYDDGYDDGCSDEQDDFEAALMECGRISPGGPCMNAGTEYCDFECPFRDECDDE